MCRENTVRINRVWYGVVCKKLLWGPKINLWAYQKAETKSKCPQPLQQPIVRDISHLYKTNTKPLPTKVHPKHPETSQQKQDLGSQVV